MWISYDLGLRGDYEGLYSWLDSVGAKECGDSVAFFTKKVGSSLIDSIREDIKQHVKFNKTDRVYIIYLDDNTHKIKGTFLFGKRKRSSWEGYAIDHFSSDEDSL